MNFEPNVIARGLVTKKMKTLGLIVPTIESPFLVSVTYGVEQVSRAAG